MVLPCRLYTHSCVLLSDAVFVWQTVSEWCGQVDPWALTHEVQVIWALAHFLPCVQHGVCTYPKIWYYLHPVELCCWQPLIGRKVSTTYDLEVQISVGWFIRLLHLASVERKAHYVKKKKIFFNGYSSQSYSFLLLKSLPFSQFSPLLLSPLLASICLPCGPVMVVADEMRLHLKWAMQGGVCSDTDGSSSVVKPYPLRCKNHLQASQATTRTIPKLIYVLFSKQSSHELAWRRRQKAKVHLTTECNSKVNHSETSASNPLVSQLVADLLILFENRKVFWK